MATLGASAEIVYRKHFSAIRGASDGFGWTVQYDSDYSDEDGASPILFSGMYVPFNEQIVRIY